MIDSYKYLRPLLAIVVALAFSAPASAQDIFRRILRGASPGPSNHFAPKPREVYVREFKIELREGEWRIVLSNSQFTVPQATCERDFPSDMRGILEWKAAVKPVAAKYLGPNMFVVKDVIDPKDPVWRVSVAACERSPRNSSQDTRNADISAALAPYGINADAILSSAASHIREVEGEYPPRLTQAELEQAARDEQFLGQVVSYGAGGEMQIGKGDQLFKTASDCDRYITQLIENAMRNIPGSRMVGPTVLMAGDGTGYGWYGCIRARDLYSRKFERYINLRMTPAQAKAMVRFPGLDADQPPASQRGSSIRF